MRDIRMNLVTSDSVNSIFHALEVLMYSIKDSF